MTLLEKFKKDHPNAPMREDGAPKFCPCHLGYTDEHDRCRGMTCVECWNREYEGEDNPVEESKDVNIADKIADVHHGLMDRCFSEAYAERVIISLIDRGYFDK